MPKPNFVWDNTIRGDKLHVTSGPVRCSEFIVRGKKLCGGHTYKEQRTMNNEQIRLSLVACRLSLTLSLSLCYTGCATPQYAIRQTPMPEESTEALEIERTISALQAEEFERQGTRRISGNEVLGGIDVQHVVDRLSRVTERPTLHYRAYLYHDNDPNAAALADGRIYISTGLVNYLISRGSRVDELAFILGHELAHTVAQHLVKRYRTLQQQQLLLALVQAGASVATRHIDPSAGEFVVNAASLLADVANSGYSQEQELEADQLGIRYVIRAGCDPTAALDLLEDFARFDNPWPFLRTHPYITLRREYLQRYLEESGQLTPQHRAPERSRAIAARRKALWEVQQLYPVGSVSWQNLQRQIDALEH